MIEDVGLKLLAFDSFSPHSLIKTLRAHMVLSQSVNKGVNQTKLSGYTWKWPATWQYQAMNEGIEDYN